MVALAGGLHAVGEVRLGQGNQRLGLVTRAAVALMVRLSTMPLATAVCLKARGGFPTGQLTVGR